MTNVGEEWLARQLSRCVDAAAQRAGYVIAACALLTALFGAYTWTHLGVNSDNVRLVAAHVPSRQNHEAFAKLFPNLENALLVVIDGETPELARTAARRLEVAMRAQTGVFEDVYQTGGSEFFEVHGLLYRDVDELDLFVDQMARLQPLLAELERDPGIETLTSAITDGLDQLKEGEGDLDVGEWARILDSMSHATVEVYNEYPLAVSWEEMMLADSPIDTSLRRVLVVHPLLDFKLLMPAGPVMDEIRAIARGLQLGPDRGVRVRITGNPALNHEEILGIAWDIGVGGFACFLIVVGVLVRALRSVRLVIAAVITLLTGLVWTAGFAAAAVVDLSLISLSFGVLFIGLGVDFAIHLGMAYADRLRAGLDRRQAMRDAAAHVGPSLALCTVTTSIGFFVFVPTDFIGVAELGLIAGTGMFVIFGLTLSLFPALLAGVFLIDAPQELTRPLHFRSQWWRFDREHSKVVLVVAAIFGAVSLLAVPHARFNANVVTLRNPTTESVQTFDDLLAQSGVASPWYVNSIAPDLEAADALALRMDALDAVSETITLSNYVPSDQDEKLEILEDLAFLLEAPPGSGTGSDEPKDVASQLEALRRLHAFLGEQWLADEEFEFSPSARSLRDHIGVFLERTSLEPDPSASLDTLADVLLSGLPEQLDRLRTATDASEIRFDDLPPDLVRRMQTEDGRTRVQTFPADDLNDEAAFKRFTTQVQTVDPKAAGIAINLVGFAQAIRDSFREALISAITIITALLFVLWRRFWPPIFVMLPLALSSLMTVAAMALFDIPFNFANVIVIPLLLGIGVDSGIHLVQRAIDGEPGELLDSTTARAVFYSALTTTVSFGTLALSSHRGIASLGSTLVIGMILTVVCNLGVLPAMVARFGNLDTKN